VSDSFHIYDTNEAWMRLTCEVNEAGEERPLPSIQDMYALSPDMQPFPLMRSGGDPNHWLTELARFMNMMDGLDSFGKTDIGFFEHVALPVWAAWRLYKGGHGGRSASIEAACALLGNQCCAPDWSLAMSSWMRRRDAK
jgi:hypothetical protein